MLDAANQVIERSLEMFPAGNILLMDVLQDDAVKQFSSQRPDINWSAFTPYFDTWQKQLSHFSPSDIQHSAWLAGDADLDAVIIYYPKAKARFDYYLSMVSKRLKPGAIIYVVGEKKGGVNSCQKALKPYTDKANKIDSARHCMLFKAVFNGDACSKQQDDWYSVNTFELEVAKQPITIDIHALPGTFALNRLDEGTELLLKTMEPVKGVGLDFGCGCGVISAALNKAFDCEMIGVDVDAIAVASSNKTFAENKVNSKAITSDGLSQLLTAGHKFNFVATNPPFHTGLNTDYGITENMMAKIKTLLTPSYTMWMVANSFLPYPALFQKYLKPAEVKTKNKRFTIYFCRNKSN